MAHDGLGELVSLETWEWRVAKAIFALGLSFWLAVPIVVHLLVFLFLFDLVSTLITSRSSFKSTARRAVVTLLLCGAVHVVWSVATSLTGLMVGSDVGSAVSLFYVLGELIEITLNCSTVITVPPWLLRTLEKAQQGGSKKTTV